MRRVFVFIALLALVAGAAQAQELTTGTLEGTVQKEDGSPIAGAIVSAIGPQGIKTTTTSGQGRYVIRGLVAGEYKVKAEAPGFGTVVQSNVAVSIGTRTQLPFQLAAGVTEEVTVISQAPVVDMKSTTTGQSINVDDFAPYVPIGRNIVSTFSIAPGVSDGGTIGAANQSISGSSGLENAYFIDGVNITNSGFGALGAYSIVYGSLGTGVTYDFLEEVQVKTGGFEAEFGQAGGGIVNSVVRTGTNTFQVDGAWYEEPGAFEGPRNDRVDIPNVVNVDETLRRDISVSAGGPIIKDKLFFFAAYNPIEVETDFEFTSGGEVNTISGDSIEYYLSDTNGDGKICDGTGACNDRTFGTPDDPSTFGVGQTISGGRAVSQATRTRTIDNYAGKLSWFVTPNHKVELTAFGDPSDGDVGPQRATTFFRNSVAPFGVLGEVTSVDGSTGLDYGGDQLSLKYQGVWTSNFFTEVLFSTKENEFSEFGPGTNVRSFFDVSSNQNFGGVGFYEGKLDETTQISVKNTHVFGPVELSYGYQFDDMDFSDPSNRSGGRFNAFAPVVADVPIDTNGDGVADGTGLGFVDDGMGACPDGALVNDERCYTQVESSTGAAVDINSPNEFNIVRTAFEPLDANTTNEESNIFAQISWDVLPNLTLKAGARWTEQEIAGSGTFELPASLVECLDGTSNCASYHEITGAGSTTFTPKTYKFDSEIAPRVGLSWDVLSDGKHKLYANYGEYFQRVPSDLAVRQFSNEVGIEDELFADPMLTMPILQPGGCWLDTDGNGVFETQTPCHRIAGGTGFEQGVILDGTIDPDGDPEAGPNAATKLPYTKEWLIGYAFEVNDYSSIEVRLINRELGRVLEDVQFSSNEQTWNQFFGPLLMPMYNGEVFAGHGVGSFGAYVLANPGDNVSSALFPVPVRDYQALEAIYSRRFHNGWMAYINYRWAELEGNYEGSYRNDNGQSDPFITSLFDFPSASFNAATDQIVTSDTLIGQYIPGPLNTDRTHILNGFLSKQFDFGLNLGGRVTVQTGQPQFPLFAHPAYQNAGEVPGVDPVYWWLVFSDINGDGANDGFGVATARDASCVLIGTCTDILNTAGQDLDLDGVADDTVLGIASGPRLFSYTPVPRDHFGRNPATVTFDVHASYDVKLRGKSQLTFLLDVFNLFNDNDALTFDTNFETRPGRLNPDYLKANLFQGPRNVRLGVKYSW